MREAIFSAVMFLLVAPACAVSDTQPLPEVRPGASASEMLAAAGASVLIAVVQPDAYRMSPEMRRLVGGARTNDSWCDHDSTDGSSWCCDNEGTISCCCTTFGFCECDGKPVTFDP